MPGPQRGFGFFSVLARAEGRPQPAPQQAAAYPLHQPRKHSGLSAPAGDARYHYKVVMFGKINFWRCRIFFAGGRCPGGAGTGAAIVFSSSKKWPGPGWRAFNLPTRFIGTPLRPSTHDGAAAKTKSPQPCRPQEIRAASPARINRGRGV